MSSSRSTVELSAKERTLVARATTTFKRARCVPLRTIRSREERRENQPFSSAAHMASTHPTSPGWIWKYTRGYWQVGKLGVHAYLLMKRAFFIWTHFTSFHGKLSMCTCRVLDCPLRDCDLRCRTGTQVLNRWRVCDFGAKYIIMTTMMPSNLGPQYHAPCRSIKKKLGWMVTLSLRRKKKKPWPRLNKGGGSLPCSTLTP